jgi:hypothetical protein
MITTSSEGVPDWKAVLAAMVYLATFLALSYGVYAFARGASFLGSFAMAYPRAFAACVLLFVCSAAFEALTASVTKLRTDRKRVTAQYVHR